MMCQLSVSERVNFAWIKPLVVILLLSTAVGSRCPPSGGGGITIAQNDATAPDLSLGAGQPGGQNVSVSAGGSAQNMTLTSRTGALNLVATAKDPQSGIRALEIWVNKKTTTCDANVVCQTTGPELQTKPTYESTSPQKNPGDTAPESSILAQALDLSTEIGQAGAPPGGSLKISLIMHAVATNHLGGRTQTPELTATWSQP